LVTGLALLLVGLFAPTRAAADTISPLTITCPDNITVVNDTYQCGADVNFVTIVKGAFPIYTVVCDPPSGEFFFLGTTTVNCTVSDGIGRTATCSFTVTVLNSVPPPCSVCILNTKTGACTSDFFMVASSPAGATFPSGVGIFANSLSALCTTGPYEFVTRSDGVADYNLAPYPVGTTVVTDTVTDPNGLSSQCSVTVTVLPSFVRLASKVYVRYQVPTPGGPVELSGPAELRFEVNFPTDPITPTDPIAPTDPIRIHALIDLHDVVATLGGVTYHATNNGNAQLTANQLSPIALSVPGQYKFEAQGKAAVHSFTLDMPLDAVVTAGALSSASFGPPQLGQP
jgi:hypothetical protein